MRFLSFIETLAFALLLFTNSIFAQQGMTKEILQQSQIELVPSEDVVVGSVFPSSPEKEFVVGEPIDLVFGFSNQGDKSLNITTISASLRHPSDWKMYIQNFTKQPVGVTVYPTEQLSFVYSFRPDPMLEPREFGISAQVFYTDSENKNYTSWFYNSTINLIEVQDKIDVQLIFTYIGIIAVASLIAFFIYNGLFKSSKKSSRKRSVETGTQNKTGADSEWLEGTSVDSQRKKYQKVSQKTAKIAKNKSI
jgi:hypothetical protein